MSYAHTTKTGARLLTESSISPENLVVADPTPTPRSPMLASLKASSFMQVFPEYTWITGSGPASMLLGWLTYWFLPTSQGKSRLKGVHTDGKRWFSRTIRELERDTGLTRHALLNARARLVTLGLVTTRDTSFRGGRSLSWNVDLNRLNEMVLLVQKAHEQVEPDADNVMAEELAGVRTISGPLVDVQMTVPDFQSMDEHMAGELIIESSESPETSVTQSAADASRTAMEKELKDGKQKKKDGKGRKTETKEEKNARLNGVRAKYGRHDLCISELMPDQQPKGPHLPWRGIVAEAGPGSGFRKVKAEPVSPMVAKLDKPKFSEVMAGKIKSLSETLSELPTSQPVNLSALASKPHLSATQAEFLWRRALGPKHGFQKSFTLKEKGQVNQLCKKLTGAELSGLLVWLLSDAPTATGGTAWSDFALAAKDAMGLKSAPTQPLVGFLLANYHVAMQTMEKAQKVQQKPKQLPHAPPAQKPITKKAVTKSIHDDPEKLEISLGVAMLNGMKPPPDLTPEQVETYKAKAKKALED